MVLVLHLPRATQPTDPLNVGGPSVPTYLRTSTANGRHPNLSPAIVLLIPAEFLEDSPRGISGTGSFFILLYIPNLPPDSDPSGTLISIYHLFLNLATRHSLY